ncbi:MAG TPA: TlyA family RNA methyltransferase [Candidatus Saccharimonadales bacterium]|nr:TlyA family RNA methyltransferase [Candidatus Saccharimonadales bacterium]
MKQRLDQVLVKQQLAPTRSQAENYIKLGQVKVNKNVVTKPGFLVDSQDKVELAASEQYVSRAGLKLASVTEALGLDFSGATVLDVGSSTGGFTDYALQHGAEKVIAVDVGSQQLHPTLRHDPRIELHEKTDIRGFKTKAVIDIVVADVSFISLRLVLPAVARLSSRQTLIVAMVKPQFEAGESSLKHKGVVKNERMRRDILKDFESWAQRSFVILEKADSQVSGNKGNRERFYLLKKA